MTDALERKLPAAAGAGCHSEPVWVGLTCGGLGWHGVEQGLDAGQDGGERDAGGGDVQTASAVPQQPTPKSPLDRRFSFAARAFECLYLCRIYVLWDPRRWLTCSATPRRSWMSPSSSCFC